MWHLSWKLKSNTTSAPWANRTFKLENRLYLTWWGGCEQILDTRSSDFLSTMDENQREPSTDLRWLRVQWQTPPDPQRNPPLVRISLIYQRLCTYTFSRIFVAWKIKITGDRFKITTVREGANKRGNSSRLTQSFHFFMFEPIFSPVHALNQPT